MKFRTWMSTTAVYLFAVLAVPAVLVMTSAPAHAQWTGGNHASRPLPLTVTADVETNANVVANNKSSVRYNVVPIGVLPGKTVSFLTNSRSVNNLGHVTGYSYVYSATDPNNLFLTGQAFIWKNSKLQALPLLPEWQGAFGFSINDLDQVAGTAQMGTESNLSQTAVLWTHGKPTNLGALGSGLNAAALDVNIFGVVAGVSNTATSFVPVAWYGGEIHPLPLITGYTAGLASEINAAGVIAGFLQASPTSSVIIPCLWYWNGNGYTAPVNLGTLGGTNGEAFGINTLNQIVGYSYNSTNVAGPAFLWSPRGGIGALPPLSGDTTAIAYNINDFGQIVGNSGTAIASGALFPQRAALWAGGTVTDIQTLVPAGTLPLTYLTGTINDLGEITINATNPDGSPDALLLVPKL